MKYHKIRNVPIDICSAEQKIAYNIAFRLRSTYYDDYKQAAACCRICEEDFLNSLIKQGMKEYSYTKDGKNGKYDIDAIFSSLRSGIREYMQDKYSIYTSFEQVGKTFKASYLNV